MATFHALRGKAGAQPKAVHEGANVVVSTFTWGVSNADDTTTSATAAAADVIRLAKIPNGATITRVAYTGVGRSDYNLGIGTGSESGQFGLAISGSSAAINTATAGIPYTVSISDEASVFYEYLTATATSAGATLSDYITVICEYTMDP